jgi:uncharacterized protein YbbC (DUF1343 family)
MTAGEVARFVRNEIVTNAQVEVLEVEGWSREAYADEFGYPWSMPSPNMPTVDTAVVYPGGCLLEGTNLSEGRGTTRPFEIFGAPFLDGWKLAEALNGVALPGATFRPLPFEPTFNKHAGRLCGGCFLHVTDRRRFRPVLTYVAILQEIIRQVGIADPAEVAALPPTEVFQAASPETGLNRFCWKRPPYEYEHRRMPIDILAGNDWLRPAIETLLPLPEIAARIDEECAEFASIRARAIDSQRHESAT